MDIPRYKNTNNAKWFCCYSEATRTSLSEVQEYYGTFVFLGANTKVVPSYKHVNLNVNTILMPENTSS